MLKNLLNLTSKYFATSFEDTFDVNSVNDKFSFFLLGIPKHIYTYGKGKSWTDASDTCRRDGGDLVSIENEREQQRVSDGMPDGFSNDYWIGFHDSDDDNVWEWSDGSGMKWKKSPSPLTGTSDLK